MDVFEQSIILPPAGAKKAGVLVASMAMQSAGVGVLLLIPLIYSDNLPLVRTVFPQFLAPVPAPVPDVLRTKTPAATSTGKNHPLFRPPLDPRVLRAGDSPRTLEDIGVPSIDVGVAQPAILAQASLVLLPMTPLLKAEPVIARPPVADVPLRVSSEVQAAKLLRKVTPEYPYLAKVARVSGTVRLTGTIAKDGSVQQLLALSGHPLLVKAALEAVRKWAYQPTILNGVAVEVITAIDVTFTLNP